MMSVDDHIFVFSVGDLIRLHTELDRVRNGISAKGYRGFLKVSEKEKNVSRMGTPITRSRIPPRDPNSVGIVLEIPTAQTNRSNSEYYIERIIVLWQGEVLAGRAEDFCVINLGDM